MHVNNLIVSREEIEGLEKQLYICEYHEKCDYPVCIHKKSHPMDDKCKQPECMHGMERGFGEIIKCILIIKKSDKRYSLKQLRDLWVQWIDECNINVQEFYEKYNLKGSFMVWLEDKEKEVKDASL